jgi:zinc protease
MKKRLLLLVLLCVASSVALAQPNLNAPIPSDPNLRTGKLPNGLTYFIRKNNKPENKVELRLVVNVGSTAERDDQQGLAHFLEHMAFNGTKNFKKNELVSYLQSIGVSFGSHLNAYTSFDETVYMLSIPTDKPGLLDKGILVLSDWASSLTLDPEEVQKERGVVLEELRIGKGADQRMRDRYFPKMFKGSIYADRLPIGKAEVLQNFDIKVLRDFYEDWYRPDLMAVVIVGSLDPDEMESKIKASFSDIKAKRPAKKLPAPTVPDHKETLIAIETDKEASVTQAQLVFKREPDPAKTLADFRQQLVRTYFNGMLNARFDEIRQSPDPPFVFGGGGFSSLVRNKGSFNAFGVTDAKSLTRTIGVFLDETNRVKQFGFTAPEFERMKQRYSASLENRYRERDKTDSWMHADTYAQLFLLDRRSPGVEFEYDFHRQVVPTITLAEINTLAKDAITPENRVIVVTGPEKQGVKYPTEAEILDLLKRADTAKLTPYVDNVVTEPLVGELATTATIKEERTDAGLGITYWELSNGVKVALKPTDFKADQIVMRAFSPGGLSLVPDAHAFSGVFLGQVAGESGVKKLTRPQLTKMMAGKQAFASISLSDQFEYLNGSSTPKDLETMLQLAYLQFQQVNFEPGAFDSFISKQKQFLPNLIANPQSYFSKEVTKTMSGNHPRSIAFPPTEEELSSAKLEHIKAIYADRFADASDFTFVFVGSFEADKMKPLILKYLGNLPSRRRVETWKDLGIRPPEGKLEKVIRKGVDQKSLVQIMFTGTTPYDRKEARDISALGELLTIKLIEILREEKGGVYGVGAFGSLAKIPYERYSFTVSFPCGPENVESLTAAALAEIVKVQNGEIDDKDVEKVKEARRVRLREEFRRNEYWANSIVTNLSQGTQIYSQEELELNVGLITKDELQKAAKKFLKLDQMKKFVLMPEATAAIK